MDPDEAQAWQEWRDRAKKAVEKGEAWTKFMPPSTSNYLLPKVVAESLKEAVIVTPPATVEMEYVPSDQPKGWAKGVVPGDPPQAPGPQGPQGWLDPPLFGGYTLQQIRDMPMEEYAGHRQAILEAATAQRADTATVRALIAKDTERISMERAQLLCYYCGVGFETIEAREAHEENCED